MRVHQLDVANIHNPGEVVQLLRKNHLQKGDKLKVLTNKESGNLIIMSVIMVIAEAIYIILGLQKT